MSALRQFFSRKSLHTQLVCLAIGCVAATALIAFLVVFIGASDSQVLRLRLLTAMAIAGGIFLAVLYTATNRLLRPLHRLRDAMRNISEGRFDSFPPVLTAPLESSDPDSRDVFGLKYTFDRMLTQLQQAKGAHDESKAVLAARTRTVDRLLEFSQNIQGAGKAEQIFATLGHFLQTELALAGLTTLTVEAEAVPATVIRACHPPDLMLADRPVGDMETGALPLPSPTSAEAFSGRWLTRSLHARIINEAWLRQSRVLRALHRRWKDPGGRSHAAS